MSTISKATQLLYASDQLPDIDISSESMPIFTTTAFTWNSISEAIEGYAKTKTGDGYSYIRTNNPNRTALATAITQLEGGEASLICASGMGAITSTLLTFLQSGDHIIYSNCCYGETLDVMKQLFTKFGVETTAVNIENMDEVTAALRPNTKIIYTEVVANPLMKVADVPALAKLIHKNDGLLIIDNTFTTPFAIQPLSLGADIVIHSLTKFLNGHSDALAGSVTAKKELIDQINPVSMFCGTPADPYSTWLVFRSLRTAFLRVPRQMQHAAILANTLARDPRVQAVYHPSIESFSGHETAKKLFANDASMCGMVSFVVSEDFAQRDEFSRRLQLVHYAPTLGGVRTTYQQPVYSSHAHLSDEERRKAGITPGLIRVSVGIEPIEDILADFKQALDAFDR